MESSKKEKIRFCIYLLFTILFWLFLVSLMPMRGDGKIYTAMIYIYLSIGIFLGVFTRDYTLKHPSILFLPLIAMLLLGTFGIY